MSRITQHEGRPASPRGDGRAWLRVVVLLALTLVLTGCGEKADVATNLTPIAPDVPEQDLPKVPQGLEEARLVIADGRFAVGTLILQRRQPTILLIDNRDNVAYQFQIVPNLVDPTPIAAATTTRLELTDPDAGLYEAQLLGSGGKVLAKLPVEIQTPAGST